MPQDEAIPLLGFLKAISFSLNQFRLYSESHPIVVESINRLQRELVSVFQTREKIVLGHLRDTLVVDGKLVTKKDPALLDLSKTFSRLNIEAITFEKGMSSEEFSAFIKLLGMRPKDLESHGGFKKIFEARAFKRIKLASGTFQLVEEGQAVLEDTPASHDETSPPESAAEFSGEGSGGGTGEGQGANGAVQKPFSIFDVIQEIRARHQDPSRPLPPIELDCEKVVVQLEKQPQELAQAAVEKIQDPAQMESVIRSIVRHLTEGLVSFLVDNAKDITRALEKFSKEIEKAIHKTLGDQATGGAKEKIASVFQEAIDHHRVQMAVKTFEKNREDPKPVQKIIQKLFQKEDVRDRLLPELRSQLVGAGFDKRQLENIMDGLDEKAAKKKSKVSIDAEELAELKRKAELADQGDLATAQQEIQKLKVEKKKVLDEKERVDAVIRNLAEGLVVVDQQGKVVLMNPAAEHLLGLRQSDKLGKKLSEGLKEEHVLSMTQGNLGEHSGGGVSKDVMLEGLNEETKRVLQASTAVVENENGQTVGMVAVLSDITKQKEVEAMKTQFVSNVSHELRTPLVAIQKSLGLILGREVGEVTPEQERFLTMAHRNIERLSRLINDLLDVAKLEARKMNLQPKVVPIQGLVNMVVSTMETWLKDKKIIVETKFPNFPVEIEADADRLTQVLTNLLGNAVKYTPEGGQVVIEMKDPASPVKISDPDCIEIGVKDNGIGIAPEDQKKIFDKFVQVSLAQPAGVSSTGLGLTIVKEIIELHSGAMFLESEEGKGSRFYFQIPKKFRQREDIPSRF